MKEEKMSFAMRCFYYSYAAYDLTKDRLKRIEERETGMPPVSVSLKEQVGEVKR